jgi:HopA1 effector protein family
VRRYREQLRDAIGAAAVMSPTSYSWFGRRSQPLSRDLLAAMDPGVAREYLIEGLTHELYRSFYSQGRPVPLSSHRSVPARPDRAFAEALSRANAGRGGWDPGWRVAAVDRCTVDVVRDGLRVRARVSDCRGTCSAGSPVSIRRPKELCAGTTGFFTALGDTAPDSRPEDLEVRLYFHMTREGAAPLVAACTGLLNDAEVPFNLKVVDRPGGFCRCDAAVLYLGGDGFDRVRDSLPAIASACAPYLRREPPAFAKPLGFGVAVGEHRSRLGGSFGSSRCRLVAEGIVAAHERGARGLQDRVDAIAQRFAAHGLDIDQPYLVPGSIDRYEL